MTKVFPVCKLIFEGNVNGYGHLVAICERLFGPLPRYPEIRLVILPGRKKKLGSLWRTPEGPVLLVDIDTGYKLYKSIPMGILGYKSGVLG